MRERGAEPVAVEVDEGEPLPDWREFDAVLAMGGPMGAGDDAEYPWLAPERDLVRGRGRGTASRSSASASGSQLLAAALRCARLRGRAAGGRSAPRSSSPTRAGPTRSSPGLEDRFVSLQWHGDTFDLPAGAVRLASSPLIPNQAFRAGKRAYGVQFHLEVTAEMAAEWAEVPAYRDSLAGRSATRREPPSSPTSNGAPAELHPPARRLFANWLDLAGEPRFEGPKARNVPFCSALAYSG